MKSFTKYALTIGTGLAVLSASAFAGPVTRAPRGTVITPPNEAHAVLWSQTNACGFGNTSQEFEAGFSIYTAQAADDFDLAAGFTYAIDSVSAPGAYSAGGGPVTLVNVQIFDDGGTTPGTLLCDYDGIGAAADGVGNLTINLPSDCNVGAGSYWVSVQADMDFGVGGQWFWNTQPVQSGDAASWQNPADGFATGCTSWSPMQGCLAAGPDICFSVSGTAIPQGGVGACCDGNDGSCTEGTTYQDCVLAACPNPDRVIHIEILTDNFPSETSWEVLNKNTGSVIATGNAVGSFTLNTWDVDINGCDCYNFTIYDAFGDGICCGFGSGTYEVYDDGTLVGSGGSFADSETIGDIGGCGGGGDPCDQCTWTPDSACGDIECLQHTGACCDAADDTCTNDVLPQDCVGGNQTWFKGEQCAGCALPDGLVHIEILTDDFGGETTWTLVDGCNNTTVAADGPLNNDQLYTWDIDVSGCGAYTFTIFDAFGDGICCGFGSGAYSVDYNGGAVCSGGVFGSSESCSGFGSGDCEGTAECPPAATGACCNFNGDCADGLTQAECGDYGVNGGDWFKGQACGDISCEAIPTVSEWGLVVMTLLGCTLGTILYSRRRAAKTA